MLSLVVATFVNTTVFFDSIQHFFQPKSETRGKYLSNAPFLVQIGCVIAENEPFQKVEPKWNFFLRIVFFRTGYDLSSVGSHYTMHHNQNISEDQMRVWHLKLVTLLQLKQNSERFLKI